MLKDVEDDCDAASEENPECPLELRIRILEFAPIQVSKNNEHRCGVAQESEQSKPAKQPVEARADGHHQEWRDDGKDKNGTLKIVHVVLTA